MDSDFFHNPVQLKEIDEFVINNSCGLFVDATCGGGGHLCYLAAAHPESRFIGFDLDNEAVSFCTKRIINENLKNAECIHSSYTQMESELKKIGITRIDGVYFDLGISSRQIDNPERGFSFSKGDSPLDMRFNTDSGFTAEDLLNEESEEKLADVFYYFGEERYSRRIARKIVEYRRNCIIQNSAQLSEIVKSSVGERFLNKSLARIYQSLRIYINDELENVKNGLQAAVRLLGTDARIAVISYHSLEDRLVKQYFRNGAFGTEKLPDRKLNPLNKKVIKPSEEEIRENKRARSARLRVAEKI